MKAYEKLGLTKHDVVEIQNWLFPMINETDSVGEMIIKTAAFFVDNKLYYALYLIGSEMGQARIKELFGVTHELNPNNI
jgi:hypothetical protein